MWPKQKYVVKINHYNTAFYEIFYFILRLASGLHSKREKQNSEGFYVPFFFHPVVGLSNL
jgi:hypothetical protein